MEKTLLDNIITHLTNDTYPSQYIIENKIELEKGLLKPIFDLQNIEQEPKFHPEGSVWNHMLQVVDNAAKIKEYANKPIEFMIAAMFHDIGKGATTKKGRNGRIISYNHDIVGSKITEEILKNYNVNNIDINYVSMLVKYHMHHLYIVKDLPYGNIEGMISEANVNDLILLFLSDRLGRNQKTAKEKEPEINDIIKILEKLKSTYNITLNNIENNFSKIKNII